LKQSAVAKTYVDALHLDKKTSHDAKRLIYWKDPTKNIEVTVSPEKDGTGQSSRLILGDFSSILEDVLRTRVKSSPSKASVGMKYN
jgi:hypothetical protein